MKNLDPKTIKALESFIRQAKSEKVAKVKKETFKQAVQRNLNDKMFGSYVTI